MNKKAESNSFVLLCEDTGKIKGILHDEIKLEVSDCIGKDLVSILSEESFGKGQIFLKNVREKNAAIDFEMVAKTTDGEQALFFSGIRLEKKILIFATNTYYVFNTLLEEMSRIINEQTNLIRSCIDEKTKIARLERQRIEKDLHDSISQTIFSTRVIAEILPDLWQRDQAEALKQIKKIKMLTTESLKEMRRMLLELRPDSFAEEDLADLLGQLIDSAKLRSNMDIKLEVIGVYDPKGEIKEAVYRITQEALNNSLKYSAASVIKISLEYFPNRLTLAIEDNGKGFDVEKVDKNKYGLFIMRDRAISIHADLQISSIKGKGTKVELHCPIE
jgi:signal transduction histidine kinase